MKSRIMGLIVAVVAILGISVTAQANTNGWDWGVKQQVKAAAVVQPGPNTVGTNELKDKGVTLYDLGNQSVWGVHIKDLTIPESKFGWDFRNKITNTYTESAAAKAKSEEALTKANEALAKPDNNTPTTVNKSCAAVVIAHLGGSFKAGKTLVCSFDLPAGTWMINTSAFFGRTAVGVAGTRPQLALRVGSTPTAFGDDYGTILGQEISPTANRELTGATVKIVTVPAAVTVDVFGFGYNDDTGTAGSGDITASADIAAVKVG